MRRPFTSNPYGLVAKGAMVDLRNFPSELQDELFLVTVFAELPAIHTAEARASLHLIDARDDHQVITTLAPLEQGKPVLSVAVSRRAPRAAGHRLRDRLHRASQQP